MMVQLNVGQCINVQPHCVIVLLYSGQPEVLLFEAAASLELEFLSFFLLFFCILIYKQASDDTTSPLLLGLRGATTFFMKSSHSPSVFFFSLTHISNTCISVRKCEETNGTI